MSAMLFATTDTVPYPYDILGVVNAGYPSGGITPGRAATCATEALTVLSQQSAKLGGNGVIGIRYTPLPLNHMLVSGTAIRIRQ